MIGGRRHIHLFLAVGIVIGSVLGFGVGRVLGPFLARSREFAPSDKSPAPPAPRPDPNVIMVDGAQAQRLKIEPVRLREFRDERTAVGRIAFNDEQTTSIFAPFQGLSIEEMQRASTPSRRLVGTWCAPGNRYTSDSEASHAGAVLEVF
jgi:hypothetical protein